MLTRLTESLRRLGHDRRGAALVVVALSLPVLLGASALAIEMSLVEVREADLQSAADAAAGAARQAYDSFTSDKQQAPITAAVAYAGDNNNAGGTVSPGDVVQGWWDITNKTPNVDKFGSPIDGQVQGTKFSNAVRVTVRLDHKFSLGQLLGASHLPLSRTSTAYKCSNLDYPYTRVTNDVPPPPLPAIYMSWATPGHDAKTSYYYLQPDGSHNPIFKFYSPYDGQDVSFVLWLSNGYGLQVDTYCAGTYLVSPAEFDSRNFRNSDGSPATVTGTVYRGSTNNSFDTYPDQNDYPFADNGAVTPYYSGNEVVTPQYDPTLVKTTPYPSANGTHYWASEGDPTPDRRSVIVR